MSETIYYFIALLFGLLIGNFTTTVYYRLPRNITIFGFDKVSNQPPICSVCFNILRFYEYLPVLSWFSTLGSCNYCGHKIDKTYLFLEIACGITSIALYYNIGFSEEYLVLLFFITISILQVALYNKYNKIWNLTLVIQIFCGIILRTLDDHSISNWVMCMTVSILIFTAVNKKFSGARESFIVIVLGAWCNLYELIIYSTVLYMIILMMKNNNKINELIYAFSLIYLIAVMFCR